MTPLPSRQGWFFLIEFLKRYFSKYWQVQTRQVFAQTITNNLVSSSSTQWQIQNNSADEQAKDLRVAEKNLKEFDFVCM